MLPALKLLVVLALYFGVPSPRLHERPALCFGRLAPGALTHALVDSTWFLFFS